MSVRRSILVVALHAIYSDKQRKWFGGHCDGQERWYEEHLRAAPKIAAAHEFDAIVLTGGHTRPSLPEVRRGELTHTEAQGARRFLEQHSISLNGRVLLEENHARDSFENLAYALLCARREFSAWPERVGVVSFDFKYQRFSAAAVGLGIVDRFTFHGIGELGTDTEHERVLAGETYNLSRIMDFEARSLFDPLHRHEFFQNKRAERMPPSLSEEDYVRRVKEAYAPPGDAQHREIAAMLDHLHALTPGPGWKSTPWPWASGNPRGPD